MTIRLVLDNLNTHKIASLYKTFTPDEARRIARRLEFHFTPIHASWLNIAEIEWAVLTKQCLKQRIASKTQLLRQIATWETERNATGKTVQWLFTCQKERQTMASLYPSQSMWWSTSTIGSINGECGLKKCLVV